MRVRMRMLETVRTCDAGGDESLEEPKLYMHVCMRS